MSLRFIRSLRNPKRSKALPLVLALAAIGTAWLGYAPSQTTVAASKVLDCEVSHVHDGDTLRAQCPDSKKAARVRIRQIDAPELDQKYGIASRDTLRKICRKGDPVRLHVSSVDQYDRLLADVHCNGTDVATAMVSAGAAWVYEQYVEDRALTQSQKQARQARKGLWQDNDAVAPWVFRRNQRQ